jgi:hypothetical protein
MNPAIEDDFPLVSQHRFWTKIKTRHFGNNWTSLFLNRPFISSYERLLVNRYIYFLFFHVCYVLANNQPTNPRSRLENSLIGKLV